MSLGTVGKFLYTLPFWYFGVRHFTDLKGAAPGWLPLPEVWAYGTGLCFLAGAVAVLTGKHAALAYKLLGALLIAIYLTIHVPGSLGWNHPIPFLTLGLAGASFAFSEKA
tara:strand:+ start:72 stop:401 length:330 start_codon:yes stop_codon:yes gene_type:complete